MNKNNQTENFNLAEINFGLDKKNRELLSTVSHDIKSPLNGILGFARLLSDIIADESQRKMAQLIEKAGNDILFLVNNILSSAKETAARDQLNLQWVEDINVQFKEIIHTFSLEARIKNIAIELHVEKMPVKAFWDMERLRLHAFNNLISNSLKFTPFGGTIRITIKSKNKHVQIIIEDSGPGIPFEYRNKIFNAHSQLEQNNESKIKGNGLGLFNAHRFIQNHTGTIRLDNSQSRSEYDPETTIDLKLTGARFIIELPLIPEQTERKIENVDLEFEQARKIQKSMLPEKLILPGFDIAADFIPAGMVGGDWYDFQHITERYAMVSVGDISGKGLGASLSMSSVMSLLRGITLSQINREKLHSPLIHGADEILRLTNNVLINQPFASFATVFLGVIDLFTHTFTYVRSGHEPALLVRNKKIIPLCSSGGPLGVYQEKSFLRMMRKNTLELLPEDRIIMFSDGLSEAFLTDQENNWLHHLLESTDALKDSKSLVKEIVSKLPLYTEGITDDITILSLRVL